MTNCPACGNSYRTGTTVLLLDPAFGSAGVRKRVCSSCANGGVVVVAPRLQPVKREKVIKPPQYDLIINQMRVLMRAANASASYDGQKEHFTGRAEGLEAAIEIVKRVAGQG
jgi:hypothetical protein